MVVCICVLSVFGHKYTFTLRSYIRVYIPFYFYLGGMFISLKLDLIYQDHTSSVFFFSV